MSSLENLPSCPIPSIEEEEELIRRWKEDRDKDALEALLKAHINTLRNYAFRYHRYGMDDMLAVALESFVHAANKYDMDRGTRFNTYCSVWAKGQLYQAAIKENCRGMGGDRARLWKDNIAPWSQEAERSSLYGESHIPVWKHFPSLDDPCSGQPSPEDVVVSKDFTKFVKRNMEFLPRRDRYVLRRRLIDTPPGTLKEVAAELELSVQAVHNIQTSSVIRLRKRLNRELKRDRELVGE
jgi:RNA polymerase sigma-32 factor